MFAAMLWWHGNSCLMFQGLVQSAKPYMKINSDLAIFPVSVAIQVAGFVCVITVLLTHIPSAGCVL